MTNITILVIDDEEMIRTGCQRILSGMGFAVECAENGRFGREKIKTNAYDLILLDLSMPELDGMQLLQEIQELNLNIITIIITGFASIESAVEAMSKGAFDFIPKPFTPETLRAKVTHGLEKRRLVLETEQLRQERARNLLELSNEKSRTHTIINSMSDGLIVTNRLGQVALINPVAQKMIRLKQEKAKGKTVNELLRQNELRTEILSALEKVQKELHSISMQFQTLDERTLFSSITPLLDEHHHCLGTVTVLRDITEAKKVEKLKSEFIRLVAHELKSPLGAIDGYLNLILEGYINDPSQTQEMIEKSRNKAKSLLALINDLLDLSKTETTEISRTTQLVDICVVLQEATDFFGPEANAKNLSVKVHLKEHLPQIEGNGEELSRLFTNLISNAIKYTPPGGRVEISAQKDKDYILVKVRDSGIGISTDDQKKIFQEFYRSRNAITRKISGTGLGLSIAKKIADHHHGYIDVFSKEGQGSDFQVFLPIVEHR